MTIARSNIVRHSDFPSMYFRVVSDPTQDHVLISPYTLSMQSTRVRVPVSALTVLHSGERAWRESENRFNPTDWTYESIGAAAEYGVPMSLKHDGERKDFSSLRTNVFTLVDGTEVRRSATSAYGLGSAADWQSFDALKAEQSKMYGANTVIELERETYGYKYAVLNYDGTEYTEQYVYGIDAETMERSTRDIYVTVALCTPTGKTLEEWRDSLAPDVQVGNVVTTRSGSTVVVQTVGDTLTAAVLKADMSLGDVSTLRKFDVVEVIATEVTESLKTEYAARLLMAEQLQALSINTVNRALQHASSNGYCSETLVALTGAGHKVPKVRVSGVLTIPLSIELDAKTDWETVRDIFGAVFGNNESWDAATLKRINLMRHIDVNKVSQAGTLTVEPVYGAPTVRPLA